MKKVAVIECLPRGLSESIISFFKLREDLLIVKYTEFSKDILEEFDYAIFLDCPNVVLDYTYNTKIIQTYPSLLPAFSEENPIKEAFLSGVKVSGVTVMFQSKIIAQFPVLIDYNTDYEEFEANILKTEKMLYPLVIKSVLDNKPFSFAEIMGQTSSTNVGCSGSCGSCSGGCQH